MTSIKGHNRKLYQQQVREHKIKNLHHCSASDHKKVLLESSLAKIEQHVVKRKRLAGKYKVNKTLII